MRDDLRIFLLI